MAWSKLKTRWLDLLAPALRGRLDVHQAGYRAAYEGRGRAWVTFDGETVASFCEFAHENAWRAEGERLRTDEQHKRGHGDLFTDAARAAAAARGTLPPDRHEVGDALAALIGGTPEAALASGEPVRVAFALLDRRLGKRRLHAVDRAALPPLVLRFYDLRCAAEKAHRAPAARSSASAHKASSGARGGSGSAA